MRKTFSPQGRVESSRQPGSEDSWFQLRNRQLMAISDRELRGRRFPSSCLCFTTFSRVCALSEDVPPWAETRSPPCAHLAAMLGGRAADRRWRLCRVCGAASFPEAGREVSNVNVPRATVSYFCLWLNYLRSAEGYWASEKCWMRSLGHLHHFVVRRLTLALLNYQGGRRKKRIPCTRQTSRPLKFNYNGLLKRK